MSKTEYWKQYWGIVGNPFSEEPLKYTEDIEEYMVETAAITEASQIIRDISLRPEPRRIFVVGARGMGKSTVLNFFAHQFFRSLHQTHILPIYINSVRPQQDQGQFQLDFVLSSIARLIDTIVIDLPSFRYDDTKLISFFHETWEKFHVSKSKIDLTTGESLLGGCLSTLTSQYGFNGVMFLYDELDRDESLAGKVFLYISRSQGLLETLSRYKSSIVIAGVPDWLSLLRTGEYSGLRGESIMLNQWNSKDAMLLVHSRYKRYALLGKEFPFSEAAMNVITEQAQRRPREILSLAKFYLMVGASQGVTKFDDEFCQKYLWKPSSVQLFLNRLSQSRELGLSYEKFRSIFGTDEVNLDLFRTLVFIYRHGTLRSDISVEALRRELGLDFTRNEFVSYVEALRSSRALGEVKQGGISMWQVSKELKPLLDLVTELRESFEFLPYVLKMKKSEIQPTKSVFDLRAKVSVFLAGRTGGRLTIGEIVDEILKEPGNLQLARLKYSARGEEPSDRLVRSRLTKDVYSVVRKLRDEGLVAKVSEKPLTVMWFPKYLDIRQFNGLPVDNEVIQDLEAAERSLRENLCDAAAALCRGAIELSLRSLYERWAAPKRCPDKWTIEDLNQEMKNKVYSQNIYSRVLGLQQQLNPIVHKEVKGIDSDFARTLLDQTQLLIIELYKIAKNYPEPQRG